MHLSAPSRFAPSRAVGARRAVGGAALVVSLALTGCTATSATSVASTAPAPGRDRVATDDAARVAAALDAVVPPVPAAQLSAAGVTDDPAAIDALADRLDAQLDARVAQCMDRAGFPQLRTAYAGSRPHPATSVAARRPVLGVHPLEMGPLTAQDATTYGMVGTDMAFAAPPRPIVESSQPAYTGAMQHCLTADVPGGAALQSRLADWREYSSRARDAVLTGADDAVRRLAVERLTCTARHGYPRLDPARFIDEDLPSALAAVGVQVGTWDPAPPEPAPLPPRTTRIVPAQPPLVYRPSTSESAFATVYADCAGGPRFAATLAAAVDPASRAFRRQHSAQLRAFSATFVAAAPSLAPTEERS